MSIKFTLTRPRQVGLGLTLALVVLSACKKDDPPPTAARLLSGTDPQGKAWLITDLKVNFILVLDITDSIPPCLRDNRTVFLPNNTTRIDNHTVRCDPNEAATVSGPNWTLLEAPDPDQLQLNLLSAYGVNPQDQFGISSNLDKFNVRTLTDARMELESEPFQLTLPGSPITTSATLSVALRVP